MNNIFITIDMDYWGCTTNLGEPLVFFDLISKNYKKEISIVYRHDQTIDIFNKYQFKFLINIDSHADIYSDDIYVKSYLTNKYNLHGSWINAIKNSHNTNIFWYHNYPNKDYRSGCFKHSKNILSHCKQFQSITCIFGLPRLQSIPWNRIDHINICYSPSYLIEKCSGYVISQSFIPVLWNNFDPDKYELKVNISNLPKPIYIKPNLLNKERIYKHCLNISKYNNEIQFEKPNKLKCLYYDHHQDIICDLFYKKKKEIKSAIKKTK